MSRMQICVKATKMLLRSPLVAESETLKRIDTELEAAWENHSTNGGSILPKIFLGAPIIIYQWAFDCVPIEKGTLTILRDWTNR